MADSGNNVEDDAGEDVESNFFDDFDKDEFMEGLKVIDSFNEKDEENERQVHQKSYSTSPITKDVNVSSQRRDLEKTNAAIRRDKEEKVKEHLAKHLESKDDLRPPGTELDDFFDQVRPSKSQKECPKYEHEDSESLPPKKHEDLNSPRRRSPVRREHSGNRDGHYSSGHNSRKMYEYDSRHSNSYKNSHRHDSNYGSRYSPQGNSRNMLQHRSWNKYHHSRNYNPPPRSRHSPHHNSWRHSNHSPVKSPRHNWHLNLRRSPHYSPRRSPRYSPHHSSRHSPRHSPQRHVMRHSPHGPRWSPRRHPRQSPNYRRSNSPRKSRRSISHSPRRNLHDSDKEHHKHKTESQVQWSPEQNSSFVLNQNSQYDVHNHSQQFIPQQFNTEVSQMNASYVYPFTGEYNNYLAPSGAPANPIIAQDPNMLLTQPGPPDMSIPQSVPMPINPVPPVTIDQHILHPNFMAPQVPMVPHPSTVSSDPSTFQTPLHVENVKAPYDALAQLVAEGKLSQEDFVKLAPNTNGGKNTVDERTKKVLNRCKQAVQKLATNANRLVIKHDVANTKILSSPQKFCSPLKRHVPVDFDYTSSGIQKNIHNKLLLNKIVLATIGLEKGTLSEKLPKDVRSIGVQTTVPFCDMCEMRDSTKSRDIAVSTDSGVFSSTVHTQVVEEDLLNSKAIFNPSGSVGSAPFSIAHLTPAQLVSQLAARAKTLQQADPASPSHQYRRRNTSNDYDGRGDAHYFNQNRYRY